MGHTSYSFTMFYTIPRQHPFHVPAAHQHPCVKEFVVEFHPVPTKDPEKKDQDGNGSSTTSPSSKVDATNAGSATANCPKTCGQAKSSLSCCRQQQPRVEHVFVQKSPIHYHEETKAAKMSLDVTGFSLDNLSIEVDDYVVSISGKRTNKLGDIFSIQRRFRLDKNTADQDSVTATLEDGVLEIIVQKKAMIGPRKISIQSSSSPASIVSKSDESTVTPSPSPSQATPNAVEKKAHAEEQTEEAGQIVNAETVQENEQVESDERTDVPTNLSDTSKINSDHDTWEEVSN